ncbi:MAG: hypothetical protein Q4D27_02320 [Coriobacteriia bacterium]|nr:hypothetical protein [Coriobacteriia bacterium]
MNKRIFIMSALAALALFSCLALSGCGIQDLDDETRKSVGFALGMLIIAASGIGFFASSRYYGKKRQKAARRNKQRAQQKRRR